VELEKVAQNAEKFEELNKQLERERKNMFVM